MKPAMPFVERLKHGPILADGAMGTMLHQAGTRLDACFDELNISHPDRVMYPHSPAFAEASARQAFTKLDVARFYERIAAWIVPRFTHTGPPGNANALISR